MNSDNLLNAKLHDQNCRDLILERTDRDKFERNFFVEAGAGSGKTECLVDRLVNHVVFMLKREEDIEKVVAITFTKKAAQEFRGRFQEKLEAMSNEYGQNEEINKRIQYALDNLEKIFMGTIHAFCARMLRESPVEAGLNINIQEMEDTENTAFLADAWNQFLMSEESKKPLQPLQKMGFPVPKLYGLYLELEKNREVDFQSVVPKPVADLEGEYRKALKKTWEYFQYLEGIRGGQKSSKIFASKKPTERFQEHMNKYKDEEDRLNVYEAITILDDFIRCKLKSVDVDSAKNQDTKDWYARINEEKAGLEKFVKDVHAPCHLSCYKYCLDFALAAVDFAVEKRKKESRLSFLDLLIYTRDMLKGSKAAREYFQQKYRYFYVDEFQDTDPLQTEILFYLAAEEYKENWMELVPRQGSLFLVGDAKQSIYRFTRVDISHYRLVKKRLLESLPAGISEDQKDVRLTTNFRSVNYLCKEINAVFTKLFRNGESETQADYEELHTGRKDLDPACTEKNVRSGIWVLPEIELPQKPKKESLISEDAPRIAEFIYNAVEGGDFYLARRKNKEEEKETVEPAGYGDFMIITYDKKDMDVYAKELQKNNIPYRMSGQTAFSDSLEITELVKVLESIGDPFDEVKAVSALRSIFLGVSDQEIYTYRMAEKSFVLQDDDKQSAGRDQQDPAEATPDFEGQYQESLNLAEKKLAQLMSYLRMVRLYSPVALMEQLINELKIVPFSLSSQQEENRLNLLFQLLAMVRHKAVQGKIYDLASLLRHLRQWLDDSFDHEMTLEEDYNAVRIMNLHKAKGLQAPVVILAKPCGKTNIKPSMHVERTGSGKSTGYVVIQEKPQWADYATEILDTKAWEDKFALEKKLLEEEHTRKLYVAATRAQNLLLISNSNKDIQNTSRPWQDLWKAFEQYLEEQQESLESRELKLHPVNQPSTSENTVSAQASFSSNLSKTGESFRGVINKDQWKVFKCPTYALATPSELQSNEAKNKLWNDLVKEFKRRMNQKSPVAVEGDEDSRADDYAIDPQEIVDYMLEEKITEEVRQSGALEQLLNEHSLNDLDELKQALLTYHRTRSEGGKRGPLWGTLVHLLLEKMIYHKELLSSKNNNTEVLKKIAAQVLGEGLCEVSPSDNKYKILWKAMVETKSVQTGSSAEMTGQEFTNHLFQQLLDTADKIMKCDCGQVEEGRKVLWQRILDAEEVLVEYNFDLPVYAGEDESLFNLCCEDNEQELGQVIIFSGVIDLLLKENDSWTIVDIKTNAVENSSELDKIYKKQLEAYRLVWEKISSENVKDVFTYHIRYD